MTQKKVLVVDDEEDIIWTLQHNLKDKSLDIDVMTAKSGEEALEVLKSRPVDLVITDIRMPGISGLDLLIETKKLQPNIDVIVMTAYPTTEFKKEATLRGGLRFIEKPFDINELRKVIRQLTETGKGFKGSLSGMELTDIIQLNCLSRATVSLRVRAGEKEGMVFFSDGNIVHSICGELEGEEAFYEILKMETGILESRIGAIAPHTTISKSFEALLMEGLRRLDEDKANNGGGGNGKSQSASVSPRKQDAHDIVQTAGIPVSGNGGGAHNDDKPAQGLDNAARKTNEKDKEEEMASLKGILSEFTSVAGVSAVCLVSRDGFVIDSAARSGIDTEMISAIAASGFGTSESMGRQLGKGNLTMTMAEYENGPVMFAPVGEDAFMVVIADKDCNLGLVRIKIKKLAPELVAASAL